MYQLARRICLALVVAALVGVPAWHLARLDVESAGLADGGRWADAVRAAGLSNVTPSLLGAPWSIAVAGVEFLDPLAGLSLLFTRRCGLNSWVAMIPTLLLVAFLGRFFCGWLCPYRPILAVSQAVRRTSERFGVRLPDLRLDRGTPFIVLLCLLTLTAIGGVVVAPWVYPPAIIGRELFRLVFAGGVGAGAAAIGLIFLFDSFVSRAGFCNDLCPGGALFRLLGLASPIAVRRDVDRCTDCGSCDAVCALRQFPMTDRLDSGCERCGKCVAACPTGALRLNAGRPGLALIHRGHSDR